MIYAERRIKSILRKNDLINEEKVREFFSLLCNSERTKVRNFLKFCPTSDLDFRFVLVDNPEGNFYREIMIIEVYSELLEKFHQINSMNFIKAYKQKRKGIIIPKYFY